MRIKTTLRLHLTADIMVKSRRQPTMNPESLESSVATLKIIVENPHSTRSMTQLYQYPTYTQRTQHRQHVQILAQQYSMPPTHGNHLNVLQQINRK